MPERDGYIPGVPCWVDTNQPDPEAAVSFYAGLFGWDVEDWMPPGSDGHYFTGHIDGRAAAAISSIPPTPRRRRHGTRTSGSMTSTTASPRCAPPGAPSCPSRST